MGPFEQLIESKQLAEGSLRPDWLFHASTGPIIARILSEGIRSGQQSRMSGNTGQRGVSFTRAPRMIREFGGWAVAVSRKNLSRIGSLQDVDYWGDVDKGSALDEEETRYVGPTIPPSLIEAVIVANKPSRFAIRVFKSENEIPLFSANGELL